MVSALILINIERHQVNSVADALVGISGVSEVYSVAGQYDLVAVVRVATNDELADVVTRQILLIDGITRTETLISFRVYSRHDLEAMFSIGNP
jgi:DNA-binding Lrp family transcriptional regulator